MNFLKESTMLLVIFICITFAAVNEVTANEPAANETEHKCKTCLMVEGECHNSTHVLDFEAPFQKNVIITELGILGNTMYFAFQPDLKDREYYKVGFVNLGSPTDHGVLVGPGPDTNFRTFDFDEADQMYIGSADGVFIAPGGKNPTHFSSIGDRIQCIFFRRKLYLVRAHENIIVEKNGEVFKYHDQFKHVKNFVIGKNNILVFLNNTGLYANKLGTNETVYLSKNAFFRGLTTRNKEDIYAWWIDGVYKVVIDDTKFTDSKIVKVADIQRIGAVTFDKDNNYWLSSGKSLYRLDPVDIKSC